MIVARYSMVSIRAFRIIKRIKPLSMLAIIKSNKEKDK